MQKKLEQLREAALKDIWAVKEAVDLDRVRVHFLGRKGELTSLLKDLPSVEASDRKTIGQLANSIKETIEVELHKKQQELRAESFSQIAETEWIDVTVPGTRPPTGHLHLTSHAIGEISSIFEQIGFSRVRYPEVDHEWYAFEALNMPKDHPARDEWETFFIDLPESKKGRVVLTPHTSNGQIHELERGELPIRMMNISKCYRRESNISHVPMFHQFEGLMIDKKVSVTHLKGVLDHFAKAFFGPKRRTRLRPFHFRFTEPSFELDISCGICDGMGKGSGNAMCRMCKEGWLELGGAGMVHPNVLKAAGVDPEEWGGFAFGWGVERTFMMKAGVKIGDIRMLYKNDLRFLEQF